MVSMGNKNTPHGSFLRLKTIVQAGSLCGTVMQSSFISGLPKQSFGAQVFDVLGDLIAVDAQAIGDVVHRTGASSQEIQDVFSTGREFGRAVNVATIGDYLGGWIEPRCQFGQAFA